MAIERHVEAHLTIDGSATVKAQVNNVDAAFSWANAETTNMGSAGKTERVPTVMDWTVSFSTPALDADESVAASILKLMWDGSLEGGGDGIYVIVVQKVSSGGTGGTATTADPTYTCNMITDGWSPISGSTGDVIGGGQTINFSMATGSTWARATS